MYGCMRDEPTWPSHQFRAMGSRIVLWLEADEMTARPAFGRAQALIAETERVLSRFDPQSELSALNARPRQWVPVSPLLWDVVTQALALAEVTGGLFDPTVLPALEAVGYTCSFADMHGVAQDSDSEAAPGCWAAVQGDAAQRALWLPAGVRLDLGGVAKGHTAQRVAAYLSRWGRAWWMRVETSRLGPRRTGYRDGQWLWRRRLRLTMMRRTCFTSGWRTPAWRHPASTTDIGTSTAGLSTTSSTRDLAVLRSQMP